MTRRNNARHNRSAKNHASEHVQAHGDMLAEANEYWRSPDDSFYLMPVNTDAPKRVRRKRVYLSPVGEGQ